MTDTRFRLFMGFFLCAAIGMLTLSEISLAQAGNERPAPECIAARADLGGMPPSMVGKPPRPPAPGMPAALPPELQQLDLSEAQQDKIFAYGHEQVPLVREQLKVADKARDALHELAKTQPFDKQQAQSLAQTRADAMAKVSVMRAEMEAYVRSQLTPEQLAKLDSSKPCARKPK